MNLACHPHDPAYPPGYHGPLCPDHVPVSELDQGRERFMAFALGYTRALLQAAGVWSTPQR